MDLSKGHGELSLSSSVLCEKIFSTSEVMSAGDNIIYLLFLSWARQNFNLFILTSLNRNFPSLWNSVVFLYKFVLGRRNSIGPNTLEQKVLKSSNLELLGKPQAIWIIWAFHSLHIILWHTFRPFRDNKLMGNRFLFFIRQWCLNFPYYYFIAGSLFREKMCHGGSFIKSCFDKINLHYVLLISIKLRFILHSMKVLSQLLKVLHLLFCQFANVSQPFISLVDICKYCSSIFQIGQTQFIWLKLAKTYINLHLPHLIYRGLSRSNLK